MKQQDGKVNPEGAERMERVGDPLDPEEMAQWGNDPRVVNSRLSLAIMGCRPELSKFPPAQLDDMGIKNNNSAVVQCRIYGKTFGLTGPKKLDPTAIDSAITYGLVGFNEGLNLLTGEFYKGGILYLPEGFHDDALSEVELLVESSGNGKFEITYAWEFESFPAKNPSGYSWRAKSLTPIRRDDPLLSLRQRALRGLTVQTPLLLQGVAGRSGPVIDNETDRL